MEKFIEAVRAHPCLWNPQHPDYPEVHARGQAWQSVIKEINDSSISNSEYLREIIYIRYVVYTLKTIYCDTYLTKTCFCMAWPLPLPCVDIFKDELELV